MLTDRPHQVALKQGIYQAWAEGDRVVMPVLPTGGGKTHVFSGIAADYDGRCYLIAHRRELVEQISLALTRHGARHNIVAPKSTVRQILKAQIDEVGRNAYQPNAPTVVASVDTVLARQSEIARHASRVGLWVQDEGHHILRGNKWGKAAALFPNAYGLAPTATPSRADGKGLGRHADGLVDRLVLGPSMRELIEAGYLCDYRIFAPPSDLDLSDVSISSSTGDYSQPQLRQAHKRSHIVGDVIEHYLRIAPGKRGITFAVSVDEAGEIAAKFNTANVPAAVIHAKTKDTERSHFMREFRAGRLLQLVNVDLFGEGVDVPAVEVVSFARATASFGLFMQQFGRALRPFEGKPCALIIDHVGNTLRHGLPDATRTWTLDAREKRTRRVREAIPTTRCANVECNAVYEAIHKACPFCGHYPEPASRSAPQYVDGDLFELDADALAKMRGEIARIDGPVMVGQSHPPHVKKAIANNHATRQSAQQELRAWIAYWAGTELYTGRSESEAYRLFWHRFGTDVLSAQTLGAGEARALTEKIQEALL